MGSDRPHGVLSRLSDAQMRVMVGVVVVAACGVFLANLFQ